MAEQERFPQLRRVARNKRTKKNKFGDLLHLARQAASGRKDPIGFLDMDKPLE